MEKRLFSLLIIIGFFTFNLKGQSVNSKLMEPEVGKPCPEFAFDKIDFYGKKHVTLDDFKGKWLVLDFWSKYCSGCIASFPKINSEQKEFKDSIQFLMVAGKYQTDERPLYSGYYKNWHLEMPCAFDSNLFKSFNVGLLPHIIIVDPMGIVKGITSSANRVKLAELLGGKSPVLLPASFDHGHEDIKRSKYNPNLPFPVQGNDELDSSILWSLLSNWTPQIPRSIPSEMGHFKLGNHLLHDRFELCGAPLPMLYLAAYSGKTRIARKDSVFYGRFWPNPVFEVRDSTSLATEPVTGRNYYCYSLMVPPSKANRSYMMGIMQNDLKNYFGYDVSVQKRKMPYWKVIATEQAKEKLKSKEEGGKFVQTEIKSWSAYSYKNMPILEFIKIIEFFSGVGDEGSPVVDETGIEGSIDITVEWFKNDYNSVRKVLQKNGLDLIKGEKEMKVWVIRDPHEESRGNGALDTAE